MIHARHQYGCDKNLLRALQWLSWPTGLGYTGVGVGLIYHREIDNLQGEKTPA